MPTLIPSATAPVWNMALRDDVQKLRSQFYRDCRSDLHAPDDSFNGGFTNTMQSDAVGLSVLRVKLNVTDIGFRYRLFILQQCALGINIGKIHVIKLEE